MPMNPELLHALEARIKAAFPEKSVEYFPGRLQEYALAHPQGAILIRRAKTCYQGLKDGSVVVQPGVLKLNLAVVTPELLGETGAVAAMERLRTALVGFTLPDCRRRLWAVKEKWVKSPAEHCIHSLKLATETLLIEDRAAETAVRLTRVTTYDRFNQEEIVP